MKRIIATICAIAVCCTVLAGCNDKNGQDGKTADSKAASSAGETTADEDKTEASEDTTYAAAYTDSLEGKDFKVTMVTSSDYMDDTVTMVETCGGDYHMSIGEDEEQVDLYLIGGVMYVLSHADKHYIKNENPDEEYLNIDTHTYTMGIQPVYQYLGTETTEDGLICESYLAPDMISGEMLTDAEDEKASIYRYYFEEGGKVPVKIGLTAYGMEQVTAFKDFSFDVSPIVLPDLTDWTDENEITESIDENAEQPESEPIGDDSIEVEQAQAGETE